MRLKQLLGIILLAAATTAPAAGPVSQLAGVQVEKRDQASVVTILANGTFTHTEYRPTATLMMVDLAGVSVAHPDSAIHTVSSMGLQSYRVVGYRSAAGAEVARIELALAPGATSRINEIKNGVEVRVNIPDASAPNPASAHASTEPVRTNHISNITVAQAKDALNIEISGSGSLTGKAMKLTGPDRIVLDIPNSLLDGRSREIPVNSGDIKAVRAAHYQSAPPVTRIVVDMAAMHEYDLVPAGNKLLLTLKNTSRQPAERKPMVAQQTPPAPAQPESKPAEPLTTAVMQPVVLKFTPTANPPADVPANKEVSAGQGRSDKAAAYFAKPPEPTLVGLTGPATSANGSMKNEPALVNAALQQQQQQPVQTPSSPAPAATSSASCTSGRYAGAPLNLDLKDLDLKDFFRLIHEISGLNVVLDPNVKGSVTIDVTDIPWDQALALVLRNNSLECELQGNVLRIATLETLKTEADARRAQQEAQALAVPKQSYTRYLSYAHSKDVVIIIKKFLSPRGDVVSDDRSNAVIIEDIPATLPKIDDLLTKLDRKTPQVEIEARVVSAQRTFARDIGTQIGFGWGNGTSTAAGGGTGVPSPIQLGSSSGPAPPWLTFPGDVSKIPLFSNLPATAPTSGISLINFSSNYRLDLILTAAETRGLVKILSRPRIVTQNNISALVEQGQRIPVVTAAQLGGPPTVTYVDAFLRLTVTPQITSDNTIFLLLDVENTTPDFSRVSGAQLNPTLNTQKTTTQVLVSDGQTAVIGGVIQTQNSLAIGQVPLLGSIPVLGHLFRHTAINTATSELLFFITPKIIQS